MGWVCETRERVDVRDEEDEEDEEDEDGNGYGYGYGYGGAEGVGGRWAVGGPVCV
jgi:hypothetical protein